MRLAVVSHPCVTPINQDFYARVQARTGWEVAILLPRRWKNEYGQCRVERWPAFRGELIALPVALAGNIPLHVYLTRLARAFRLLQPDAVYVHHEAYGAATFQAVRAARGLGNVPVGFYSAQSLEKRYPWPVAQMERSVYRRADFALPVSADVANVLESKGFQGRTEVLPLPVDTERFRSSNEQPRNGSRPFTAGFVGRLAPEKGVETVLEAIRLLDRRDARLLVIGDGPARVKLEATAGEIGIRDRVTWAGYVQHDAVAHAYGEMDVLVVPSQTVPQWKEPFGRVVIEALAFGVPVIASDSGELPHLVNPTEGGWTFPEGKPQALAGALAHVHDSPAEAHQRGVSGREAVERLFDADVIADRFATIVDRELTACS